MQKRVRYSYCYRQIQQIELVQIRPFFNTFLGVIDQSALQKSGYLTDKGLSEQAFLLPENGSF